MINVSPLFFFFFFNDPSTTEIYTLSLHDALPIFATAFERQRRGAQRLGRVLVELNMISRSEEHTSELQSADHLVCRLLLEKKKRHALRRHLPIELVEAPIVASLCWTHTLRVLSSA